MKLNALTENELLLQTKTAIRDERISTLNVLRYFREIERRRAYMNYPSLYELATKHFEYSEGSAQRRIYTMRFLRDLPEYKTKFESGELTLMTASLLQAYFRRSKLSRAEKVQVVNACLKKSTRTVQKEIARREPESDKRQDVRYSNDERIRLSLNISEELYQTLEKLKFEYRAANFEEVIERLAGIKKPKAAVASISIAQEPIQLSTNAETTSPPALEVGARHDLEFDHITPFSKGGPHLTENLRLLCSHHNKLVWLTEQKNLFPQMKWAQLTTPAHLLQK